MRLVRENAWINPWLRRFLSTQRVLSDLESKPVRNMSTTMTKSICLEDRRREMSA